jgi:hypothetical protein
VFEILLQIHGTTKQTTDKQLGLAGGVFDTI